MEDDCRIIHQGFSDVYISHENSKWLPRSEIEDSVQAEWQKKVEQAKEKGKKIPTAGPMARVKEMYQEGAELNIKTELTDYAYFVVTRDKLDLEDNAYPLSVGALLRTSDGKLVLGTKKGTEQGEGETQLAGAGFMNPEDLEGRTDADKTQYKELKEEVNVSRSSITQLKPKIVISRDTLPQPMIVYLAYTDLTYEQVLELWKQIPDNEKEFSELYAVEDSEEGIEEAINSGRVFRPHALTALRYRRDNPETEEAEQESEENSLEETVSEESESAEAES